MLKFGRVSDRKSNGTVRVKFEADNFVSDYIPFLCQQTNDNKTIWIPDVNSYVACLMDARCENGVVLGCIYTGKDEAPSGEMTTWQMLFDGGGEISYDTASKEMNIKTANGGKIKFNDGTKGEMVILDGVFDRLRAIEDKLNSHITLYNGHVHPETGSSNTLVTVSVDTPIVVTVKNDLKNIDILQ
jgi:phage baseplate assembly protein V